MCEWGIWESFKEKAHRIFPVENSGAMTSYEEISDERQGDAVFMLTLLEMSPFSSLCLPPPAYTPVPVAITYYCWCLWVIHTLFG